MSGISSLGVGSGLDLGVLVERLLAAERAPVKKTLDRSEEQTRTRLSAYGSLRAAASTLLGALEGLSRPTTQYRAVTSGAPGVQASVASAGGPEAGAWSVRVMQLASAQSLASEAFADVEAPLGTGTLTLRAGANEAQIALGPDGVADLRGLRDAINASSAGVQAALVRDGEGMRLLLTARTSGAAGEIRLDVTDGVDPRLAGAAMTETAAAQNASFSINGLVLSASSNRIDHVVPGVVLTLTDLSPENAATTVTVAPDQEDLKSRLGTLVSAFNTLRESIASVTRYAAATGSAGPLLGDSATRSLQSELAGVFSRPLAEPDESPFASLASLGVGTGPDGKVRIDETRLAAALTQDQAVVRQAVARFADDFAGTMRRYAGGDGLLQTRVNGLNDRLQAIGRQREALDLRMAQVETRLRAQFSAMDAMVAQFSSTSRFLADQLATLGNLRPGRSG
jgi:flagellar hook-associated protein 2